MWISIVCGEFEVVGLSFLVSLVLLSDSQTTQTIPKNFKGTRSTKGCKSSEQNPVVEIVCPSV